MVADGTLTTRAKTPEEDRLKTTLERTKRDDGGTIKPT